MEGKKGVKPESDDSDEELDDDVVLYQPPAKSAQPAGSQGGKTINDVKVSTPPQNGKIRGEKSGDTSQVGESKKFKESKKEKADKSKGVRQMNNPSTSSAKTQVESKNDKENPNGLSWKNVPVPDDFVYSKEQMLALSSCPFAKVRPESMDLMFVTGMPGNLKSVKDKEKKTYQEKWSNKKKEEEGGRGHKGGSRGDSQGRGGSGRTGETHDAYDIMQDSMGRVDNPSDPMGFADQTLAFDQLFRREMDASSPASEPSSEFLDFFGNGAQQASPFGNKSAQDEVRYYNEIGFQFT